MKTDSMKMKFNWRYLIEHIYKIKGYRLGKRVGATISLRQPKIYLDHFLTALSFCQLLIIWTKILLTQTRLRGGKKSLERIHLFLHKMVKEILGILLLDLLSQDLLEILLLKLP